MFKNKLALTVGAVLLSGFATSSFAAAELLERKKTRALFTGSSGTHWYLSHDKWHQFDWKSGGEVVVTKVGTKAEDKPVAKGKWRIKEVEKKKGMTDADVEAANAEFDYVYCHQIEGMWGDHEICWEAQQETFDKTADKKLLPKQQHTVLREGGGESGEYHITRR